MKDEAIEVLAEIMCYNPVLDDGGKEYRPLYTKSFHDKMDKYGIFERVHKRSQEILGGKCLPDRLIT